MPAIADLIRQFPVAVTAKFQVCWRLLLLFSLVFPSLATVSRYGGNTVLLLYLPYALTLVWLAERLVQVPSTTSAIRLYMMATAVAVASIIGIFVVIFPIADVAIPGHGSDTDEAYDLAVHAMVEGLSPYEPVTYLGNRIHHLPGALLLATPFVMLATSAWQNLCWTAIHAVITLRVLGAAQGCLLFLLQFAASPVLLQQIVTGSDGVMSGISTVTGLMAFLSAWSPQQRNIWLRWLSCLLFAVTLSNRLNFAIGVIPAVFYVWQLRGTRQALGAAAGLVSLLALINLPYYLLDPDGFAPLEGLNRIGRSENVLPYATMLLPMAATLVSIACCYGLRQRPHDAALLSFGSGQCLLVVGSGLLSSFAIGAVDLSYSYYGCYCLYPLSLLAWQRLVTFRCKPLQQVSA